MRLLAALLALPLLALLPAAPAGAQGVAAEEAALMQADRDFARAAAARRLEGWMSYFTDDAVRLRWRDPAVRGLDAIRKFDAALFADSTATLTWEPVEAGLYQSWDGRGGGPSSARARPTARRSCSAGVT
jgi:hypothetical protein